MRQFMTLLCAKRHIKAIFKVLYDSTMPDEFEVFSIWKIDDSCPVLFY